MKIGLFFGSFNPPHIGHLAIAEYFATQTDLEEVWLVVSPHNPLKEKSSLAHQRARLELCRLALGDNPKLRISDIEFSLPLPSYTIDTLTHLEERYPKHDFSLLMGSDSLASLPKWKNYELLLERYKLHVYQRLGVPPTPLDVHHSVTLHAQMPQFNISATYIRQQIQQKKSIRYLCPNSVIEEIERSGLYR